MSKHVFVKIFLLDPIFGWREVYKTYHYMDLDDDDGTVMMMMMIVFMMMMLMMMMMMIVFMMMMMMRMRQAPLVYL